MDQFLKFQVVRADAVQGRQAAVQDVVDPLVAMAPFHGHGILWLLDHAQGAVVPLPVGADGTELAIRQIETDPAEMDLLFCRHQRFGQPAHLGFVHIDNMVGQTQGGLAAHAGQAAQLVVHIMERLDEAGHITCPEA